MEPELAVVVASTAFDLDESAGLRPFGRHGTQ
jgi:hypothetical protein